MNRNEMIQVREPVSTTPAYPPPVNPRVTWFEFALATLLIVLVAADLLPTWVILTALTGVGWRTTR